MPAMRNVSHVAAFTGHMVDPPDRPTPRFSSEKVEAVRQAIAERLKKHGIVYGFSSAARGSDLLFLEELTKMGSRARVFLPFPREEFKKTSVGYGWDDRFDTVLKAHEVVELSAHVLPAANQPEAYANCSRKILEEAVAKAKVLKQKPLLIAVWNRDPGDGAGGTADAVHDWTNEGHDVVVIDISKL
jgi:hypothetical protein